ncbi:MAG: type II toxin-antitoxin system antitoxin DNA ADP-ribosyl glycohydrolase DarG [Egibacteraceae bacterium]
MINVVKGDLFESEAQTLVNTVNCVGVMGKGIALGFRKRFPDMYEDYVRRCASGDVWLGRPYLYKSLIPPWVLNFPTKDHWRSVAKLSDITNGLDYLAEHYQDWGIESLAVPPLGCGEGQLDWRVVGPTLYRKLASLDVDVELYAPYDAPESELAVEFLACDTGPAVSPGDGPVRLDPAAVALAVILRFVEREPYHWPIGRTTFQKLAYFATQAGIPTGLEYRRGSYGPFSDQLKRLQTRLVNNGLIAERRLGKMFEVHTGPTYEDAVERYRTQIEEWRPVVERVADLLLRADTARAEVLASAHYAAAHLVARNRSRGAGTPTEQDAVDEVLAWKVHRKPPLDRDEVAAAVRGLNLLGWISMRPSDALPLEPELAEAAG